MIGTKATRFIRKQYLTKIYESHDGASKIDNFRLKAFAAAVFKETIIR